MSSLSGSTIPGRRSSYISPTVILIVFKLEMNLGAPRLGTSMKIVIVRLVWLIIGFWFGSRIDGLPISTSQTISIDSLNTGTIFLEFNYKVMNPPPFVLVSPVIKTGIASVLYC